MGDYRRAIDLRTTGGAVMLTHILCRACRVGAIAVTVMTITAAAHLHAQGTSYEVPGIVAWSTAKTYGFTFAPEASSGESVSRPLDGMNTRLTRTSKVLLTSQTFTVAQVVGGQPSVNPGERNTTFKFFAGRTMQPGWTVKSVDVGGNYTYVEQPRLGTSDLSFRVRLAPGGSATLRKIVLTGPAGADWKDAFSAPLRKDYVINGVVAWNAAQKYGFTFTPVYELSTKDVGLVGSSTPRIIGLPDGVSIAYVLQTQRFVGMRCTEHKGSGTFPFPADCIIGQIVGGNMSVTVPVYARAESQSVAFKMFASKKLSPGWIVKSVSVSAGSWTQQPAYGSDDATFVLTLTSRGDVPAIAIVRSLTLEGPSNAASFEDAFKNAH